jgi:chorismate mutase
MMTGRIITFQLLLHDAPGILSSLLNDFANNQVNILTINSIVPTNGCAVVTISAETMNMTMSLEALLQQLRQNEGVIKAEILAG